MQLLHIWGIVITIATYRTLPIKPIPIMPPRAVMGTWYTYNFGTQSGAVSTSVSAKKLMRI